MKTKSIRKLYSVILIAGLGLGVLPPGLHAQRGPQDSWYLNREVDLPVMPGLNAPHGFDFAPNGDVYVSSRDNDRVSVWGADGAFKTAWSSYGSADGQLWDPHGLAIGPSEVYVTDIGNDRVQVFDLQGNFLRKWGSGGSADGRFNNPWGIALDVNGSSVSEVYVVEYYGNRVQVFDANGTFLRKFGVGQLDNPADVKIGPDGLVYVSSSDHHKIKVFQKDGTYLREFGTSGSPFGIDFLGNRLVVANGEHHTVRIFETNGTLVTTIGSGSASSDAGLFAKNYGVAADASGDLHVSCRDNHRIQVFDANGTYKRTYGSYGSAAVSTTDVVRTPENTFILTEHGGDTVFETDENGTLIRILAKKGAGDGQVEFTHGLDLGPDGRVYVSDTGNHRIQVFERNGTLARTFGSEGSSSGKFNQPWGIAVSQAGEVYVADSYNHRIQVFDLNGTFRRKWGTFGNLNGQLNRPLGLDLDDDGSVVVADYNNNLAVVFDANGTFLRKWTVNGRGHQVTTLNNGLILFGGGGGSYSNTHLKLYEKDGTLVKEWNPGSGYPSPVVCLRDGTLVLAHRGKDTLQFYRPTYRTVRPGQSKEIPFPEVISAAQRPGTDYLDLTYRINDADSPNVKAALLAFADGGNDLSKVIVPKTFVGDVTGKLDDNVSTGQTHTVTWNAGADWNIGFGEVEVAVLAQDDRDLLNVHFLNLPATDANSTQLKISRSPITDDDLLKIWYWLLASKPNEYKLNAATVVPAASSIPAPPQGFTPANLPGLKLWLDANDVDGDGQADSIANDSNVTLWTDKAGGDHNATTQGNNAIRPTYKPAHLNGKAVLAFDGSQGFYVDLSYLANSDYTIVVVEGRSSSKSHNYFMGNNGGSNDDRSLHIGYRNNGIYTLDQYGDDYNWIGPGDYLGQVFREWMNVFDDDVGHSIHLNGSQMSSNTDKQGMHSALNGQIGVALNYPYVGDLAEILVFTQALTAADRANLSKYLAEKWGEFLLPYATGSSTTDFGRTHLLDLMNLREATAEEVTRAKEGATSGTTNQFEPTFKVGPAERPVKVNEYGFDTGATSGFWVVPTQ